MNGWATGGTGADGGRGAPTMAKAASQSQERYSHGTALRSRCFKIPACTGYKNRARINHFRRPSCHFPLYFPVMCDRPWLSVVCRRPGHLLFWSRWSWERYRTCATKLIWLIVEASCGIRDIGTMSIYVYLAYWIYVDLRYWIYVDLREFTLDYVRLCRITSDCVRLSDLHRIYVRLCRIQFQGSIFPSFSQVYILRR